MEKGENESLRVKRYLRSLREQYKILGVVSKDFDYDVKKDMKIVCIVLRNMLIRVGKWAEDSIEREQIAKFMKEKVHIDAEDEEVAGINFHRVVWEASAEMKTDGTANTKGWMTAAGTDEWGKNMRSKPEILAERNLEGSGSEGDQTAYEYCASIVQDMIMSFKMEGRWEHDVFQWRAGIRLYAGRRCDVIAVLLYTSTDDCIRELKQVKISVEIVNI